MANDMDRLVDVFHKTKDLKYSQRFSAVPEMENKDSVAAHMWRMSIMAIISYHEFNLGGADIDLGYTLSLIQAHDLDELDSGDIDVALIIAGERSQAEKDQIGINTLTNLKNMLPKKSGEAVYDLWSSYEKRDSREAKFVKALDLLEATLQLIEGGAKCIDYPDEIVSRPQTAVRNFPEISDLYFTIMDRLKPLYEEAGLPWKPEYNGI